MAPPTAEETVRLEQAVVAKATRILMLAEAPLGIWGEVTELGTAVVRPDYQIHELLLGLHYRELTPPVTVGWQDVVRVGLQTDPADFPTDRIPDVERALTAAVDWIGMELRGFGAA